MELTKQVVSLELSRKLKELGVKQESLFIWSEHTKPETLWSVVTYEEKYDHTPTYPTYSAFTVAELGELLKFKFSSHNDYFYGGEYWYIDTNDEQFHADTEADARAKMLIYLLENKLI